MTVAASGNHEIEIKFRLHNREELERNLSRLGFRQLTPSTFEVNTLFDFPDHRLRGRGELLRIRRYGKHWTVTHKAKAGGGRHKSRVELETRVDDGEALQRMFAALDLEPSFLYEKYRSEWSDSTGHVVLDHTPIGDFGEIEGPAEWIDRTAAALGIAERDYITDSYATLFAEWKRRTGSGARDMRFKKTVAGD